MRLTSVFEFFLKLETGGSFIFENIKEPKLEQDSDF